MAHGTITRRSFTQIFGYSFFSLSLALILALSLGLTACGKKNNPKPPEDIAPNVVQVYTAIPQADGIILTWQSPDTDVQGAELRDLASFTVSKNVYSRDAIPDFEEIAEIPVEIERSQLPAGEAAVGAFSNALPGGFLKRSYAYKDKAVQPGKKYEYTVTPVNQDGVKGVRSNILRVTFLGQSSLVERF